MTNVRIFIFRYIFICVCVCTYVCLPTLMNKVYANISSNFYLEKIKAIFYCVFCLFFQNNSEPFFTELLCVCVQHGWNLSKHQFTRRCLFKKMPCLSRTLKDFPSFIICELLWFLGNDSSVVSHWLCHGLEFKELDWMPCKFSEPSLGYRCTHFIRKGICDKVKGAD